MSQSPIPGITIRAAKIPKDLECIRQLLNEYAEHLKEVGVENVCFAQYEQELARLPDPYRILLLAFATNEEDAGEPAGCVLLQSIKPELTEHGMSDDACEMKRLWVRPQFRRFGTGRKLVETLIDEAQREGYKAMYLDTVPQKMRDANRLYRSLGFEPTERYNRNPVYEVSFFRRAL